MITIRNLTFKYRTKDMFDNLDMDIEKGKITSIIGEVGNLL